MGLTAARDPGRLAVEPGMLATVVTTLQSDGPNAAPPPPSPLVLTPWPRPEPAAYRTLFRAVGGPWLWFSRLTMNDARLGSILGDPLVRVWRVFDGEEEAGFLELDTRSAGLCELQYVGLVPTHAGRGHGAWLIAEALRLAWGSRVERVRVQTCTLDHPAALPAYRRAGFRAVSREVQMFPDPRLVGLLPRSVGAHVPLIHP